MKKLLPSLVLILCALTCPAAGAEGAAPFTDVSPEDWFAPYVEVCAQEGLMQGTGAGRFEPEEELTLAQAIALTVRTEAVLHQTTPAPPLPRDLNDLICFYDQDGALLGNWSIASRVTQPGELDTLAVTLDCAVQPEQVTMHMELDALCRLSGLYTDAARTELPGRYDPRQKLWRFETEDGWGSYTLELLTQLPPTWYRDELIDARRLGALADLDEEAFDALWPDRFDQVPATRLDLARMISAVADVQDLWPVLTLDPPPDTQDRAALRLYSFGVLQGVDEAGRFAGEAPLTRGQAAAVFARVLRPELRQRPAVTPKAPDQLTSIQVSHGSFGFVDTEYLIDLDNALLWTFSADPWLGGEERDPSGENQGFQASLPLDPQEISRLRQDSSLPPLLSWSGFYASPALDGHQWAVTLTFSDGESRQISGSNAYPEGWDELYDALYALTGRNILEVRSDWIDLPDWREEGQARYPH